jgi:hypothetical protein
MGLPVPFVCNETYELEEDNYGVFLSDNDLYIKAGKRNLY